MGCFRMGVLLVLLAFGASACGGEPDITRADLDRAVRKAERKTEREQVRIADARVVRARSGGYRAAIAELGLTNETGWWAVSVLSGKPTDEGAVRIETFTGLHLCEGGVCQADVTDDSAYSDAGGSESYDYGDGSYDYEYGPDTTEEYGSGSGYSVMCEDGTMSDSGGIQGACSWHGGVADQGVSPCSADRVLIG